MNENNQQNNTCICGHGQDAHEYAMKPHCAILIHKRNKLTGSRCPCEEFKQDNLKYLEAIVFRNGY